MAQINGNGIQHPKDMVYDPLVEDELYDFECIEANRDDMDVLT
jgi:hypothetical protein